MEYMIYFYSGHDLLVLPFTDQALAANEMLPSVAIGSRLRTSVSSAAVKKSLLFAVARRSLGSDEAI